MMRASETLHVRVIRFPGTKEVAVKETARVDLGSALYPVIFRIPCAATQILRVSAARKAAAAAPVVGTLSPVPANASTNRRWCLWAST